MMRSRVRQPYVRFILMNLIMNCRAKPGNDSGEAGVRYRARDRLLQHTERMHVGFQDFLLLSTLV